jgi:hypothetical protein
MGTTAAPHGAEARLMHEIRSSAMTVLYLAVRCGAIQACKAALLTAGQLRHTSSGFALITAMVPARFLMLGEAVNAARRIEGEPLVCGVLRSAALMMLIVLALIVVEELVAGAIRGQHPARVFAEHLDGGRWAEFPAYCLLLLPILLPYLGLKHLAAVMGPDACHRALRGQR